MTCPLSAAAVEAISSVFAFARHRSQSNLAYSVMTCGGYEAHGLYNSYAHVSGRYMGG